MSVATDFDYILSLPDGSDVFTRVSAKRIIIEYPNFKLFKSRPVCHHMEVRFRLLQRRYEDVQYMSYAHDGEKEIRRLLSILVKGVKDGKVFTSYIDTLKITDVAFNPLRIPARDSYPNIEDIAVARLKTLVDEHWKRYWKPTGLSVRMQRLLSTTLGHSVIVDHLRKSRAKRIKSRQPCLQSRIIS
jgi:hypothetical protein